MPVFALANGGVPFGRELPFAGGNPVALGALLGLFVGKQGGVTGASLGFVRAGLASLPAGATWRQLDGIGCLCGIGLAMSLFIANPAFGGAGA